MVIALLGLRDQCACGNDDTCNNVRALIEEFGRRIFEHAILLGDVKEAVLREAPAIGYLLWQGRSELLHLVAHAAARAIGHHPDFRSALCLRHRPTRPQRPRLDQRHSKSDGGMGCTSDHGGSTSTSSVLSAWLIQASSSARRNASGLWL